MAMCISFFGLTIKAFEYETREKRLFGYQIGLRWGHDFRASHRANIYTLYMSNILYD